HGLAMCILLRGVWSYRNTTAVIFNRYTTIRMNRDADFGAVTSQRFINRIINYFIDEVMQCLDIRAPHIHTRAFPHMLNTFKRLNGTYIIVFYFSYHKNLQRFPLTEGNI